MLPKIGDTYSFRKTFSESDVYLFGGIIGDSSPWHIDEVFARNSRFGKRLVYGMLTASLFSTIIGRYFPGYVYLSQDSSFRGPVFIGDTIEATVVVTEVTEKGKVTLQCRCTNEKGEEVLVGTGKVIRLND